MEKSLPCYSNSMGSRSVTTTFSKAAFKSSIIYRRLFCKRKKRHWTFITTTTTENEFFEKEKLTRFPNVSKYEKNEQKEMSTRKKKHIFSFAFNLSHKEERKSAIQAWKKDSIACCCLFASHSQISPKLSHGRLFCSATPLPACLLERQNIEFHQTNLKIMTCGMHFSSCCCLL